MFWVQSLFKSGYNCWNLASSSIVWTFEHTPECPVICVVEMTIGVVGGCVVVVVGCVVVVVGCVVVVVVVVVCGVVIVCGALVIVVVGVVVVDATDEDTWKSNMIPMRHKQSPDYQRLFMGS